VRIAEKHQEFVDPVAAYDYIAPAYSDLSAQHGKYLAAIEELVVEQVPPESHSMLDIGSGDGTRALRVAQRAGIKEVVLLEPSSIMRTKIPQDVEIWPIRAEEICDYAPSQGRQFDVITCLWNVLGHIRGWDARVRVLHQICQSLSPRGRYFLDVQHRYNVRSYGMPKTVLRFLYDHVRPQATNGDVVASWRLKGATCSTFGHVFTNSEILKMARKAGLKSVGRSVVDYQTGEIVHLRFQGNLLYYFRRTDANDSARVFTTTSTSASVI